MAGPDPSTSDPFASEGGQAVFDLRSYLWTAKRFWWIIAIGLLLGLGAGIVLVKTSRPEFISSSEIRVERRAPSSAISLSGGPLAFEGAATHEDLKTIERSFANPGLMRRVAGTIRMSDEFEDLEFQGHPAKSLSEDQIAGYLMGGCSVSLIPETRLIQISFRNENPEMARQITDLIVQEGIRNDLDQRIAASEANIRYLRDEVKKFEESLRASEEKLNTYTRTLGNVSIDADLNIVATQLQDLNARATAAKAERLKLESEYSQIQSRIGDPDKLMEIESIQRLPAIISLSNQIGQTQGKIDKLRLRYRESSPFMEQARSELAGLQEALQREILAAPVTIETALAGARRAEENILREQELQEEKVIQVRDLSVPSRVLQRQIDADRLALEAALKRLTEELSQARSQPVLLQLVNPAGYGVPSGSKPIRLLGAALFAGCILGFGGVFLIMQLDTSLKSALEAERYLELPVLCDIPENDPEDRPNDASLVAPHASLAASCPTFDDRNSDTAEAFRTLRAALPVLDEEQAGQLILLAGVQEGDGTSFSALNLAVVLAQSGQRTLLIDSNLRKAGLEKMVFPTCGRIGLAEFLHRETGLANILHATPVPLLDIITAGGPCPFPSESLSKERFSDLVGKVRPLYDKIVVDSAPMGKISDSLGIAPLFSRICLVISAGRTPRDEAVRVLSMLSRAGAEPTGIIFNHSPVPILDPVKKHVRGKESSESEPEASPSIGCPSCGKIYSNFAQFLNKTKPGSRGSNSGHYPVGELVWRKCSCGYEMSTKATELRDLSPAGKQRRQMFEELLQDLLSANVDPAEARQFLLLYLKIWRNESPDHLQNENSPAAAERFALLSGLLDHLAKGGLSKEEARNKLHEAVDAWRTAP